MIGDYQLRIPGSENPDHWLSMITANGMINFDTYVEIQTEEDPDAWVLIPNGHFTVSVKGSLVVAIKAAGGTISDQRQAVLAIIESMVADRGIIQSDAAARAFVTMLPNGEWPESDITRTITVE